MKDIKQLINQDPQQLVGSEKQEKDNLLKLKRKKLNLRLWDRLTEIYGHQIASQFGEQMPESWEKLLRDLTPDQIKDGLNRLSERQESWPPNAVEFRNLCLPRTISPNGHNSAAYLMISDPKHPKNDPNSPEYCPKPKGIESDGWKSKRKEKAKKHIKDMLKGL